MRPNEKLSDSQINKCGKILVSPTTTREQKDEARSVIELWRNKHLPYMDYAKNLIENTKHDCPNVFVAQRLKRMPTIEGKLQRIPSIRLSKMQDIGGVRAIFGKIDELRRAYSSLMVQEQEHGIIRVKDYCVNPKPDGYRGIHVVFAAAGDELGPDKYYTELQMRTRLQHIWATSVEIYDLGHAEKLKYGQGPDEVKRFFMLLSSLFAVVDELGSVHGDFNEFAQKSKQNKAEILDGLAELVDINENHGIVGRIYSVAEKIKTTECDESDKLGYYVLKIDVERGETTIREFSDNELDKATAFYAELERQNEGTEIDQVLVNIDSFNMVRDAYPNYFADVSVLKDFMASITENAEAL